MADTEVPWPVSTSPGQRPQEGAGRLINVFAEPRGVDSSGNPLGVVWHRVPGVRVFASGGPAGFAQGDANANAVGSGSGAGAAVGDAEVDGVSG